MPWRISGNIDFLLTVARDCPGLIKDGDGTHILGRFSFAITFGVRTARVLRLFVRLFTPFGGKERLLLSPLLEVVSCVCMFVQLLLGLFVYSLQRNAVFLFCLFVFVHTGSLCLLPLA